MNAYLDSRGSTAKEVRLFCISLKCNVNLQIFIYDFNFVLLCKVDNMIQSFAFYQLKDECTLAISTITELVHVY